MTEQTVGTESVNDEILDIETIAESMDGWDQIAMRKYFNEKFDELAKDGLMFARACLFIHLRRDKSTGVPNSAVDKEAFREAMGMPLGTLQKMIPDEDGGADFEDETAIQERDREFAEFVIGTGLSYTVDQFMALTINQRANAIEVANRRR